MVIGGGRLEVGEVASNEDARRSHRSQASKGPSGGDGGETFRIGLPYLEPRYHHETKIHQSDRTGDSYLAQLEDV